MEQPRKALASKQGKVHWAYGNMSLCLQFVGEKHQEIEKEVDCKRCLKIQDGVKS